MITRLRVGKKTTFRLNKESLSRRAREPLRILFGKTADCHRHSLSDLCIFPPTLGDKIPGLRVLGHQGPQFVSIAAFIEC